MIVTLHKLINYEDQYKIKYTIRAIFFCLLCTLGLARTGVATREKKSEAREEGAEYDEGSFYGDTQEERKEELINRVVIWHRLYFLKVVQEINA